MALDVWEAAVAASGAKAAVAALAVTVAVLTFGIVGIAIFTAGVIVGWLLPHPRQ